ncbi:ABC transporter permease [Phycisphaera mikurensis]|uniref:ABC transporter permease protein n=1 Tax=Phycisphaera mikurensis (strain NBRC 102666 / KCTC 22515 / FYK2301M01) TaxID=1142394 RepID=I0IE01_PHYMF|nr:ABC transporter permease [Phycisphaera mikurensis]MBB6441296.1 NitT/TauT family transport system permease protein [Phycisphaera mikurensis]BAM03489.1 ABC transporter permease protein [Phycisphaera mikurensis NBRC 102666]
MAAPPSRSPWFAIRREVPTHRSGLLMAASFAVPVLIWCVLAYVPLFHADYRLTVVAERQAANTATLTVGDRVEKGYFQDYLDEVAAMNEQIRARVAAGDLDASTRSNTRILRALRPVAESNGLLAGVDTGDSGVVDAKLYELWLAAADGERPELMAALSEENQAVVRGNAEVLRRFPPEDRQSKPKVREPLLNLLPQGVSASPVYLPSPGECIRAFVDDFTTEPPNGQPWMHERLLSSLKVVFGGFGMAVLIGLPLGILCGCYGVFARLFEPFTDFFRYMPAPTFSLLLVAAFGVEGAPKLALVFIGTFPHLLLMTGNTTRTLDANLLEAAQTLGCKRTGLLTRVVIPGTMPHLYNDLRVLLGWAWTWLVIAELIGTKSGLTGFIDVQGARRNFDRVFPVIIMIGLIGFTTDQLLQFAARRLFPWANPGRGRSGWWKRLRGLSARRRDAGVPTSDEPTLDPGKAAVLA